MPTYEYACEACKHEFEEFQSITSEPLRKCPKCGKLKLKRLIGTGGGVIFKGSGFYQTDYRSESYKKGAEAEKPKIDGDAKGDAKKADSAAKPAETKSEPAVAPKETPIASKPATDGGKSEKKKKAS